MLITATTTQVADFAREVGGDRVAVTQILSPNSDPHEYEPRPSDAESLVDADLIVRSGGDVDEWLDQIVDSSGSDAPEISLIDDVADARARTARRTRTGGRTRGTRCCGRGARAIELAEIDPDGAAGYRRPRRRLPRAARPPRRGIARCMDAVPADERKLVTSHDALGYYADRYGIEVIGAAIPALARRRRPQRARPPTSST